ncbi:MAG: methyltransferase domain-containing protein [Pseudomonadota bacterium]
MFETSLLALRRARAARLGFVDVLHAHAAAELSERLNEVNRALPERVLISGWPAPWQAAVPRLRAIADGDLLDLSEASVDLVVHGLSLHSQNDPVGQLIQCRRALRPDGLFVAMLFAGQSLAELRACLAEAEIAVTGGLSPRVHPMADLRDLGGLLQRAGFALPVADTQTLTLTYRSLHALMHDLRAMGEGNVQTARHGPLTRAILEHADTLYRARFPADDGRIAATVELVTLTGWAPAPSQPQPLRPGSATTRLEDALLALRDKPGED